MLLEQKNQMFMEVVSGGDNVGRHEPENVLRLAENMPVDFLYEQMQILTQRRNQSGRFGSAWAHIEYALCAEAPLNDFGRDAYISTAQMLLQENISNHGDNKAIQLINFQSTVVCSYLPLFKKRALGIPADHEDAVWIYKSLGAALDIYVPRKRYSPAQRRLPGQCAEVVAEALAARTGQPGHILYPASPREECSPLQAYNHDFYQIGADNNKYPVQMKGDECEKTYEPSIRVVQAHDIILCALRTRRRLKYKLPLIKSIHLNHYQGLIPFIIKESAGNLLTEAEKRMLDAATEHVIGYHKGQATAA